MSEGVGWLKKHLIELLLGVLITVLGWVGLQTIALSETLTDLRTFVQYEVALIRMDIEHIEESVISVEGEEKTLRAVVEENRGNIGILIERTKHRYPENARALVK